MKNLAIWLLIWALSPILPGQTPEAVYQDYDLFALESPLEVEMRFDYKAFLRNKNKDEYQAAQIRIFLDDSTSFSDTIRMKARGEFRKRYCGFPPIRLNFKGATFPVPALQQLEKVKLVTHCKNSEAFQQYIFKEYLAYKSYNLLTDKSFRVRLVHMKYVDSEDHKKTFSRYGFIIEDVDDLADRLACIEIEREGIHPEWTDREQMTLVAMYEYMIGNTDWNTTNLHNVKLIQEKVTDRQPRVFVVPYDFDYSGLVNAMYAIPDERLNIGSVRNRYYMGFERSPAELSAVFALLAQQKEAIYALFQDDPYLDPLNRKECIDYLDEFYATIENPKRVQYSIEDLAQKQK